MASRFEDWEQLAILNPCGYGKGLECLKHNEQIKLFCQIHIVAVCHLCALKDHQKPCELSDVADVIKESEVKVNNLKETVHSAKTDLAIQEARISACGAFVDTHLGLIKRDINHEFKIRMNMVREKSKRESDTINREADEEIQRINREREERLRNCSEEMRQRETVIKNMKDGLLKEVDLICKQVQEKLVGCKEGD